MNRWIPVVACLALALPACSNSGGGGLAVVEVDGQVSLVLGSQVLFTAKTVNATDTGYAWASSNPVVADVDGAGVVTARATGQAMITATGNISGVVGEYPVVVTADPSQGVPFLAEWSMSGHADVTAEAFRHWDDDGEIPESCARCHSTHGFRDFIGDDGSAEGVVDQPAALGSTVECTACHSEGALLLNTVTFPSGATIPSTLVDEVLGREAVCMTCHQGRESTMSVDDKIASAVNNPGPDDVLQIPNPRFGQPGQPEFVNSGFTNIHYFAAAATRYGSLVAGGYLYDDPDDAGSKKPYDVLFKHVPGLERCQDCHNPHTLEIRLDVCSECHNVTTKEQLHDIRMFSSVTRDYDGDGNTVEGLWHEINGPNSLRSKLLELIMIYARDVLGQPIVYDGDSYPYFFKDTDGDGVVDPGENIFPNQYGAFSARLLRATFNYQYATKDPGGFAHNGKYIIQLLVDAIEDLREALPGVAGVNLNLDAIVRNDSGHFDGTAEAFRHWDLIEDEDGIVPASCAKCHSGSAGFEEFLTYGTNTPKPVANGFDCAVCHTTFNGSFETRRIEQVTFPGGRQTPRLGAAFATDDPIVQSNTCMTCHQGRVSRNSIDDAIQVFIETPDSDKNANGQIPNPFDPRSLGFQNVHYLAAAATLFGTEAQVAYEYAAGTAWQQSTLYAPGDRVDNKGRTYECLVGGVSASSGGGPDSAGTLNPATQRLEIQDGTVVWKTRYEPKFPHVSNNPTNTNHCVFCHNPVNTKHTFLPNDNLEANQGGCRQCHTDNINGGTLNDVHNIRLKSLLDYDGDGRFPGSVMGTETLKNELATMADALFEEIEFYADNAGTDPQGTVGGSFGSEGQTRAGDPILYNEDAYPYFHNADKVAAAGGRASFGTRYTDWDGRLLKAAHNFQQSQKEHGAWAHNFPYIVQLVFDSIDDLATGAGRPDAASRGFLRP